MHISNPNRPNARQFLTRGLIAGLLLAQPAATALAQTTTADRKDKGSGNSRTLAGWTHDAHGHSA